VTTDSHHGRADLGIRLKELRTEAGLTGKELAVKLGWQQSKVSKLETGRQTATINDLKAWARATGQPDAIPELKGRLHSLESTYRPWCRQLAAGHRAAQDTHGTQHAYARTIHAFSTSVIPGILQTPDYAHSILSRHAELHGATRDLDAGVDARMRWQDNLYTGRTQYHVLMWEAALHVRICSPEVLVAQLDRLISAQGLRAVQLGIIPLAAEVHLPPSHDFYIFDEQRVIADAWHTEMWLNTAEEARLYRRIWDRLNKAAVYRHDAHKLLMRARVTVELG